MCSAPRTLERFVRRGRAAKADDADFDVASDVSDTDLVTWLEKPGSGPAWQLLQLQDKKKLVKYLPPGNVQELYQHYGSTRKLLGVKPVSCCPKLCATHVFACCSQMRSSCPAPSYSTFARVYNQRWKDVLRFRDKSLFLGSNAHAQPKQSNPLDSTEPTEVHTLHCVLPADTSNQQQPGVTGGQASGGEDLSGSFALAVRGPINCVVPL